MDANTIKKMDSNLFRGQEINEVYMEIMKTLPTSHMEFDQVWQARSLGAVYITHTNICVISLFDTMSHDI